MKIKKNKSADRFNSSKNLSVSDDKSLNSAKSS